MPRNKTHFLLNTHITWINMISKRVEWGTILHYTLKITFICPAQVYCTMYVHIVGQYSEIILLHGLANYCNYSTVHIVGQYSEIILLHGLANYCNYSTVHIVGQYSEIILLHGLVNYSTVYIVQCTLYNCIRIRLFIQDLQLFLFQLYMFMIYAIFCTVNLIFKG